MAGVGGVSWPEKIGGFLVGRRSEFGFSGKRIAPAVRVDAEGGKRALALADFRRAPKVLGGNLLHLKLAKPAGLRDKNSELAQR